VEGQDPFVKRRLWQVLACIAALSSAGAAGCGTSGPSREELAAERTRLTALVAPEIQKRERQAAVGAASRKEAECRSHLGRALSLLDERPELTIGRKAPSLYATFDTYRERVDEIDTELGRIPRGSLNQECLQVLRVLTEAGAYHKEAHQTWLRCVLYYSSCDVIVRFYEDYEEILRLTWQLANRKVKTAKTLIRAVGDHAAGPAAPSVFLPRTEQDVAASIFGLTAKHLCEDDVPEQAIQPCQTLRDVLTAGVGEDEEEDLNKALSDLLDAYGLNQT
jgi:hypothetical protein